MSAAPDASAPAATANSPRRAALALGLGVCAVLLFGGSLPATRLVVAHLDPWFLTAARAAIPGVIALGVFAVLRRALPARADWPALIGVMLGVVVGFPAFAALAMLTVPASHGAVVLGIMPLATAVFAALLAGERPSASFWALALLGAALVVAFAARHGGAMALTGGDAFLFGAVLSATLGYVLSARLVGRMPGWEVISWAVVAALPLSLPATMLLWPADPVAVPAQAWAAVVFVGLFPQFIAFFFWNVALAMGGIARIGQLQLLQSFCSIGLAALWNGETIEPATILFALAVAAVVLLGQRARVRR